MTGQVAAIRAGSARATLILLALISGLASIAIHMVVPGLPLLARDFGIGPAPAQQVVAIYLVGLTIGQLVAGPAADRHGRKPVLLAGLAIYVTGATIGALAPGLEVLLAARLLQACGAAGGLVASRAIVGDLFDRSEAGRRQATLMGITLLSPALAPVIGGLVAHDFGWRPILWILAFYGLLAGVICWTRLPESLPRGTVGRPAGDEPTSLASSYRRLLANRRFCRTTGVIACTSSTLYMFLSSSSFILIDSWGLAPDIAGFCFLAVACGGIVGTLSVGWLERRVNALLVGVSISLFGALLALVLALSGAASAPALIGPVMLVAMGAGISAPSGIAAVVHAEPGLSATAASLAGATQMGASALASTALALAGRPNFLLLASALAGVTSIALALSGGPLLSRWLRTR